MPFVKGQRANPHGRPKGSLNVETLTKLERKAHFDKLAAEQFERWIRECRPEYGLDQLLGKASDVVELITKKKPTNETQEKLNKLLKKVYGGTH